MKTVTHSNLTSDEVQKLMEENPNSQVLLAKPGRYDLVVRTGSYFSEERIEGLCTIDPEEEARVLDQLNRDEMRNLWR
jgi:hypothetical protein